MLTASEIVRTELFFRVLEYRINNPQATIAEACKKFDVPESTFYRWVASDRDAMVAVKESLNSAQRSALLDYSQKLYTALSMVLDAAIDPSLKVDTRLKVLKFAMPLFEDYANVHHATPGTDDQAPFLKEGPKLTHVESRLAGVDIGITEDGIHLDITQKIPVIDAVSSDSTEDPDEQEDLDQDNQ